jgi:enoyl-[acyl-carrier protein] reductase I
MFLTMADLTGKVALVTGVANKRSIAFAVAEAFAAAGARQVITYLPMGKDAEREKIERLTEHLRPALLLPLDVADPASIAALYERIGQEFGTLDILVHSIASARREELAGRFSDISEEGFQFAQTISAYSLISLCRGARPLMTEHGAAIMTLSYIGSVRAAPNYNVMGHGTGAGEDSRECHLRGPHPHPVGVRREGFSGPDAHRRGQQCPQAQHHPGGSRPHGGLPRQ